MKLITSIARLALLAVVILVWIASIIDVFLRLFSGGDIWGPMAVFMIGYIGAGIIFMIGLTAAPASPLLRKIDHGQIK